MTAKNNDKSFEIPDNQMDAKKLKRKALSPYENYIANVIWTFLGLSFFFMTMIAILKYNITLFTLNKFVIDSWEDFIEIWLQGSYAAAFVTFILITFFKYRERQSESESQEKSKKQKN